MKGTNILGVDGSDNYLLHLWVKLIIITRIFSAFYPFERLCERRRRPQPELETVGMF